MLILYTGGRDCGSVVIWDMRAGQVVCGARVSRGVQGDASAILPMMRRGQCFVTAGDCHLAVWTIDLVARNVRSLDVAMLKLKRHVLCMDRNERDEVFVKLYLNYTALHLYTHRLCTVEPPLGIY